MTTTVRRTARIIVLDEAGAVLLLKTHWSRRILPERWLTPGGGIDEGEDVHAAAARELFEETGLRVASLGEPVWHERRTLPAGHEYDETDATYFLLRVPRFQIRTDDWTDDERDDIVDVRWFSPEELAASTEDFDPEDVRAILRRLRTGRPATAGTLAVRAARDFLFAHATDYDGAVSGFAWPQLDEFNFALEWFDVVAGEHPDRAAVTIVSADLTARSWTYGELSRRSDQVANWLVGLGLGRGDAIIVMLGNTIELWEIMLGIAKIGAVSIPTSTLLSASDLQFRVDRAAASAVVTVASVADRLDGLPGDVRRIGVGADVPDGWTAMADSAAASATFTPDGPTPAGSASLLYFTSGTTSRPKLVEHSQVSYPVGHLSTMWWLGLRPGDVHLNISSPGWGKHAWSSFYAPFLAQATVFAFTYDRFDATTLMQVMDIHDVSTFCAPATVWRMLIQSDLRALASPPRELVGAGEPLNPEVIARVRDAWGATIRDGYGQTEMTCCVGNSPGQRVKDGSMGRPLPGYPVVLLDPATGALSPDEGEIALDLSTPVLGLMSGYHRDPDATAQAARAGYFHTGDIAARDADGYLTFVGRADDVFKASDYKISPFELESVLLEHEAVTEAAIVPSPHPVRLATPKAYVCLASGGSATSEETARSIFAHADARLSAHLRVRIIEFVDELPKTISGKIRRVELRRREADRVASGDESGQFRNETRA